MIDSKKFKAWSKEIYDIAAAHGWHDEEKSDELWMSLIMSEVANINLEKHVDWKIRYNSLRPFKHGGKKY